MNIKLKKIVSAAMASMMLAGSTIAGSLTATAADGFPFTDVPTDSWFREYVEYVYENDLMNGVDTDRFGPSSDLTRAMFVTIIGRLHGISDDAEATDSFPDTEKDTWYSPYVGWAAENKIVGGYDDGTFRPDAPVSREEAAVIVDRYVDAYELTLPRTGGAFEFADESSVQSWATDSLSVMRNTGLMLGDESRNFNPGSSITRAEAAAVIMRLKEARDNAWTGYVPNSDDDSIILGAKYLYWTGSLTAGGMAHTLGEYGGYPALRATMNKNTAEDTYLEPNTVGVSIHYMPIDVIAHPYVKVCYVNNMGGDVKALYSANKTLKEQEKVTIHDFLDLEAGADENGMKTAVIDLTVINEKYPDFDYETGLANLVFLPCGEDYAGDGTFDIRYIGFFKDKAAAESYKADSDNDISDYLKNYEPYTTLKWSELTDEVEKQYSNLLVDRIAEIKNTESELTPEMITEAGGTCWYVSSIHGDDSNDGKSPDKAFGSPSALYYERGPVTLCHARTGDGVFFERGSEFYPETYGESSLWTLDTEDGVSYGAYGEGPKPLFTCAVDLTDTNGVGEWTLVEGTTDVYELKPELIDKDEKWRSSDIGNIIFDGGKYVGIRIIPASKDGEAFVEGTYSYDKGWVCNGREYYDASPRDMSSVKSALSGLDLAFVHDQSEGRLYLCSKEGNPADRFEDIKISRGGRAIMGASRDMWFDNLAIMYSTNYGAQHGGGHNIKYTNCEIGYVGGGLSSIESGIEIYGTTDDVTFYNNYVHDVCDGPLSSQHAGENDPKIEGLVHENNVIVSSGNGSEIFGNVGKLDENGVGANKIINCSVKGNLMAYIGYGITQTQDTGHNKRGSVICGSMYGEISHSIVENNIFFHANGDIYGSYMATYDQPRGWQAKGNTYVCPVGLLNSNIGFCYETLNYINHNMWKRTRIGFRYEYETLVWYTGLGIDPTGTYYWYNSKDVNEQKNCFFMTGYWAERGGFKPEA